MSAVDDARNDAAAVGRAVESLHDVNPALADAVERAAKVVSAARPYEQLLGAMVLVAALSREAGAMLGEFIGAAAAGRVTSHADLERLLESWRARGLVEPAPGTWKPPLA